MTRHRVLRSPAGRVSLRWHNRALWVAALLVLALLALGLWTMLTGTYRATAAEVLSTIFGNGPKGLEYTVNQLRTPRLLAAVAVGLALGLAGSVFQSTARNPLASPDLIGFSTGTATGALLVILALQGGSTQIALGAFGGGLATALVIYLLAARRGLSGYRIVLTGVGINALLEAVNAYLLTRADIVDAQAAHRWLAGSLNEVRWDTLLPPLLVLAVLLPLTVAQGRRLAQLELGDELAKALGMSVGRGRLALLLLGVALVAIATAIAGPVAFVALAAPQLARRLARAATPGLASSALMGAVIVVASDLLTQRALAPVQLPVGVGTAAIGGLYLAWLLIVHIRRPR
ncbi:FecCD family ABC transporter permease [Crossiella sp. CA198]|uniref:FecCD family ABC transporter permease n=1 Tax=Crossiella sp. CA198 TaxID=3455607 RepID=UPI003F8D8B63